MTREKRREREEEARRNGFMTRGLRAEEATSIPDNEDYDCSTSI